MTTKKAPPAKKSVAKKVAAKTCSVRGCTAPAVRRGMCSSKKAGGHGHYRAWLRAQRKDA